MGHPTVVVMPAAVFGFSVTLLRLKERTMQKLVVALMAVLLLSATVWAQNPVSDALRNRLTSAAKNTIAAAEEMPADKYGYKPTDAQVPFGHWVSHATGANYLFCSKLT